jgi:hypothetical protein
MALIRVTKKKSTNFQPFHLHINVQVRITISTCVQNNKDINEHFHAPFASPKWEDDAQGFPTNLVSH